MTTTEAPHGVLPSGAVVQVANSQTGDTLTFEQGPVASLRDSDQIVIRQSNGRDMLLPVSVLLDYVAHAITQATTSMRVPADRVDGLAVVAISGHYKDLHGKPDNPGGGGPQG